MNCNCCNCSRNNSCDENGSEIKIYGTLVNVTLDNELKDARDDAHDPCKAKNEPANVSEEGHNGALVYAYQVHDGRFRQDDESMLPWERFQDEINKRITNVSYDNGITTIEGDTHIENLYVKKGDLYVKLDEASDYDDAWLQTLLGATPAQVQEMKTALGNKSIMQFLIDLANTCLWEKKQGENAIVPKKINGVDPQVHGAGFYDTTVQ